MNSSNDPLDKLLQQRFQQLFDGEQAVPDASLKQKIWNRLASAPPRRYRPVGLVGLGVLLLVGAGLYYGAASLSTLPKRADARELHAATRSVARGNPAEHPPADVGAVSQAPGEPSAFKSTVLSSPVVAPPVDMASSANPSLGHSSVKTLVGPSASSTADVLRPNRSLKATDYSRVSRSKTRNGAGLPIQKSRLRRPFPPSLIALHSASRVIDLLPITGSVSDLSTSEPATSLAILALNRRPLAGLLSSQLSAHLARRVDFSTNSVAFGQSALTRPAVTAAWFFTAAPMSTYQRMTIIAKTDTYVQDVSFPAPWSLQTWGYQVSGGIRLRGWDAAASYGQLRRWAYYERAIDAYQVEPTNSTAYQVKRQLEAVAENVSLSLVGLSMGKQYTWGKHHRYYAQAGAQFTYVLTTQQPLGWLQAGWGLSLPLGKEHQLQVGPTLAYSLSDIWSTDHQLQIYPYTAGLSLTIRP